MPIHKVLSFYSTKCLRTLSLLLCLFLLSGKFSAQKNKSEIDEIECLLDEAHSLYMDAKAKDVFLISEKEIIPKAKKANYEKGLCIGYYYIASSFYFVAKYRESLDYIKKSQEYSSYLLTDPIQKACNYGLIGDNYRFLGLYSLSRKNYHITIDILRNIRPRTTKDLLTESSSYSAFASLYQSMNIQDSVYYYFNKEKSILKNISLKDAIVEKGYSNLGLGDYHLDQNNLDSANYYYHQAIKIYDGRNMGDELSAWEGIADVDFIKGNYESSLKNYHKALKICEKINDILALCDIYEKLGNLYVKIGDIRNAERYLKLNSDCKHSLSQSANDDRNFILNELMKEEKQLQEDHSNRKLLITILFFSLISLIGFFGSYYFIKQDKLKSKVKIKEKEQKITEKEIYVTELEDKLKTSLEEVMHEAKTNSPSFFEKFQLLYPLFTVRLLDVHKGLNSGELMLLAYVYLNFTSKEIGDFTFRSYRTIQTRKYHLRKKLEIEANEDLYIWLRNLCEK